MSLIELFILAVGLSMDAFAVAICTGLTMPKATFKKALIVGLYFGIFQAGMPVIGYFVANLFADKITAYDHWIAFALLCFLGGKMIWESFKKEECGGAKQEASLGPNKMLPLAIATSIDALAVGVSFAFLRVSIVPAVSLIGVTTLAISMAGVKIGNVFGRRFKSKAELAGGVILVLIGVKILLEHLKLNFRRTNMDAIQITTLALLGVYYIAYTVKALALKRQGIAVNLMGKGSKPKKALVVEMALRFATLAGAVVQFGSALLPRLVWSPPVILPVRIAGMALLLLGNLIFIVAMLTMRNNWRAGFDQNQNTSLVTNGIYQFSRNPAFVGFDLLYIGCAAAFPNIVNMAMALACIILFHVQILGEERFCADVFGQEYADYKSKTMRYIGKRKSEKY